jgi:hypothetical protein
MRGLPSGLPNRQPRSIPYSIEWVVALGVAIKGIGVEITVFDKEQPVGLLRQIVKDAVEVRLGTMGVQRLHKHVDKFLIDDMDRIAHPMILFPKQLILTPREIDALVFKPDVPVHD